MGQTLQARCRLSLVNYASSKAVVAKALPFRAAADRTARAALRSVDHSYERAARVLSASEWRVFSGSALPLAWRSCNSVRCCIAAVRLRARFDFGAALMVAGKHPRTGRRPLPVSRSPRCRRGPASRHVARVLVVVVSDDRTGLLDKNRESFGRRMARFHALQAREFEPRARASGCRDSCGRFPLRIVFRLDSEELPRSSVPAGQENAVLDCQPDSCIPIVAAFWMTRTPV